MYLYRNVRRLLAAEHLADAAVHLIKTGGSGNASQQAVEAKAAKQFPNEVQHACQEEAYTAHDLSKRLCDPVRYSAIELWKEHTAEGIKKGTKVALCFRERIELVLGPLDCAADLFKKLKANDQARSDEYIQMDIRL